MALPLRREDYTVGWVCALPVELAAAQEMLDEEHPDIERDPADNDENLYALGSIGGHNVAIVCLPAGRIGNNPAAAVATQMRATFKKMRFGLMVGIGGGVPSDEADVRLGDVVVSQPHSTFAGVVQYDLGKTTPSSFERTGSLNSPPQMLLAAVARVQAKELRGQSKLREYITKLEGISTFQRSKAGPDVLFKAAYNHKGGQKCEKCSSERHEARQARDGEEEVVTHYGTIASGNQVIKDASVRDKLSAELGGVLCFEMEAAGLMNSFPCLVVRGICDYADSHKNKRWQAYAAGTAAAYAKEVLSVIPPADVTNLRTAEESMRDVLPVITHIHQIAEDHKNVAQDGLAISRRLLEYQQKAHERTLSKEQANCLQLFRLTRSTGDATYQDFKERIADRVEGTCMWFLNHPHFQEWKNKEFGPLLVSADPGCGKSVLAKYLVDRVLAGSSTVCYFFFKDQVQNTVREALCALLHQLFSQKRNLLVHAIGQYEKDGASLVYSTSSLWSVFSEAMQDANAGPVTIVLDALDECAEAERRDLLQHMESQVRRSKSSKAKLKLLMTSRPYEHVVSGLHSLSEAFPHIRIPGEEESEVISQEVNLVTKYRVEQLAKEKKLKDDVKGHLADMLLKITHRTYLWTYLVFDCLRAEDFKKTPKGVESAIAALPKSVNQAYERILSKSKEHGMVRKALGIILAACRPLSVSEMNVAVNIESTSQSLHSLDLEEEEDFKSRLRSWCGLFVSIHHGQIFFIHQTAREFLLANLRTSAIIPMELQWHHSITIEYAHTVLAELCVRYLNFFCSDASPPTDLTWDSSHHEKPRAFLDYSAKFWVVHFRAACISNDDAVIAPIASRISDPNSTAYSIWSRLYWKAKHMGIPRFTTGLTVASYFGHSAVAGQLIDKGADLESKDARYARTPLSWAATNGHEAVVKVLLEKGADLESKDETYARTPLSWAATNGHEAVVKVLLEETADPESEDGMYGQTPLSLAATNGHEAVVKILLEKGADVESKDKNGQTSLWWATTNRHEVVAKLLVEKGADLESKDKVRFAFHGRYRMEEEDVITPEGFPSHLHNGALRTRGTMGLTNLGNTGWMNSALQCIRSVEELAGYFLQGKYKQDINVENPIGYRGAIAEVYARLLAVLYSEEGTTSFAPKSFRDILGRANSLFSGYEQQDTTEFLSWLIDALHEDLNRIQRKPYREDPASDDKTVNEPEAIKALGDIYRSNHRSRNDSMVDDLFKGFYKVMTTCLECNRVGIDFWPYHLFQLQVPIEQASQYTVRFVSLRGKIWDVKVDLGKNATIRKLKEYLGKRFGVKCNHLMASEVRSHKFYHHLDDKDTLAGSCVNQRGDIYLYELDEVPSNWPIPMKRKRTYTDSVRNHDYDNNIPHYADPYHDRVLIPIFHRAPNPSSPRAQQRLLQLWPSYIIINREEAKDYDAILKKVLGRVAQMTTQQISAVSNHTSLARSRTSSGIELPDGESVDDEGNIIDITTTKPAETLMNPSVEDGDAILNVLRPTGFSPPEFRQLFEMKHTRATKEFVTTGWNTINDNEIYEAISERIRVSAGLEPSSRSFPSLSDAPSSEEEGNLQFSADPQSSIEAATRSKDEEDERLIKIGEAIILDWNLDAYDALFNGTGVDDQRGMDILKFVETLEDRELQTKKAEGAVHQSNGITIEECFAETYKAELLFDANSWYCPRCKELRCAARKLEIWTAPDVLLVQLRRFRPFLLHDKIDVLIDFPIEGLDLTNKVGLPEEKELVYDLSAVINHYDDGPGRGINTAFAKNFFDQQWYEYNNSSVRKCVNHNSVVTSAAYLLCYRRRSNRPLGPPELREVVQAWRNSSYEGADDA